VIAFIFSADARVKFFCVPVLLLVAQSKIPQSQSKAFWQQ
jgi:hypothetical protein